jgi:hypothetical protein
VGNVNGTVRIDTHVNGAPLSKSITVAGASSRSADQYLGVLNVGDTVYVGIGPSVADGNDTFTVDFKLAAPSSTDPYLLADYRDDYQDGAMPGNWRYMWNAPTDWDGASSSDASTGDITSIADFELLNSVGTTWRPDTDTDPNNGSPARYLQLSAVGGHPGRGSGQNEAPINNTQDRYVITAYDVPLNGIYSIANSFFSTVDANGNGNNVRVFTSASPGSPVFDQLFAAGELNGNFDTTVGSLSAGETIYVAVGPSVQDGADSFQFDYSILYQVPEPNSAVLIVLGVAVLMLVRRRV